MSLDFNPTVGQPIRSLQTQLRKIALNDPDIPTVIPDGIFGNETKAAVTAFQKKHQLPITGEVDKDSWDKIFLEYSTIVAYQSKPICANIFPSHNHTINPGDKDNTLLVIQAMMVSISEMHSNIPHLRVTGIHYENSVEATKALQEIFNQEPTGVIDKAFWNNLALLYESSVIKSPNIV